MPERSLWPPVPRRRVPLHRLPRQPELSKVKVLHVITRFVAGSGGNTFASAAGMDPDRYEMWVAAMPGGPLWEQARAAGVGTVEIRHMRERISPWHDLMACRELTALIRREQFTVVHTHCSKAGLSPGSPRGWRAPPSSCTPSTSWRRTTACPGEAPDVSRPRTVRARVRPPLRRGGAPPGPQAVEQRVAPPGRVVSSRRPSTSDHPRAGRVRRGPGRTSGSPSGRRSSGRSAGSFPRRRRSTSSGCAPGQPSAPGRRLRHGR